jgi:hypothetical protein
MLRFQGFVGEYERPENPQPVDRYKTIIGRRLHARTPPNQWTEAKIGCNVLNRMTRLGMPASVRVR